MTSDEQTVLMIRGAITELPEDQQKLVMDTYYSLKESVSKQPMVAMAIALIGAELASNEDYK